MIYETDPIQIIKNLNLLKYKIAELNDDKEKLEQQLLEISGHNKEGQTTYKFGQFKVQITTGIIYTLNKAEYEVMKAAIPKGFDPVTIETKTSYNVSKRIMDDVKKYGSKEDNLLLSEFISDKPSKLSVKILPSE